MVNQSSLYSSRAHLLVLPLLLEVGGEVADAQCDPRPPVPVHVHHECRLEIGSKDFNF